MPISVQHALFNAADSARGIPLFAIYFIVAIIFLALATFIYTSITKHHEMSLLRSGNEAAAWSMGGLLIGLALPLHKSISQAGSVLDMLLWAGVGLLAQILGYYLSHWLLPNVTERMNNGEKSMGITLGLTSIAIGLINAASMTY